MSGVSDWSRAEKELYALGTRVLLDDLERQQQEWRESWALDSTSTDEMTREHNAKMRQLEEAHKQWLAGFLKDASGAADEPAPTQDVAGAEGATVPTGHRPQQPTPHEAELQHAREIHDMPMHEYAARRAELGVQSPTSMNKLFS